MSIISKRFDLNGATLTTIDVHPIHILHFHGGNTPIILRYGEHKTEYRKVEKRNKKRERTEVTEPTNGLKEI